LNGFLTLPELRSKEIKSGDIRRTQKAYANKRQLRGSHTGKNHTRFGVRENVGEVLAKECNGYFNSVIFREYYTYYLFITLFFSIWRSGRGRGTRRDWIF
jgi:hypothetical protein